MKMSDERFDYYVKLALIDCGRRDVEMFDSIDDSEVVMSPRLDKKVRKLIKNSAKKSNEKRNKIITRIAISVALAMALLFACMMSVSAIRDAIWKSVIEWKDDHLEIRFEGPTEELSSDGSSSDKPVAPPTHIEEVRKPRLVPQGAEESSIERMTAVYIEYYKDGELICIYTQHLLNAQILYFDNVNADISKIDVGKHTGDIIRYDDALELIWNDSEYVYVLETLVLDEEYILAMAESVK